MLRQRIRARSSRASLLGRVVLVLFLLAVVWYGLMLVLLGLGVSRGTVDLISGYRTGFDFLAALTPEQVDSRVRLVAGLSGLAGFLIFGYLAYKELPRPYVARRTLALAEGQRGDTEVSPRAIERVAEGAAFGNPAVTAAAGRWEGDGLIVNVHLGRAQGLPETMRDVKAKVTAALGEHELPAVPVGVTLTGFDQSQPQREIS